MNFKAVTYVTASRLWQNEEAVNKCRRLFLLEKRGKKRSGTGGCKDRMAQIRLKNERNKVGCRVMGVNVGKREGVRIPKSRAKATPKRIERPATRTRPPRSRDLGRASEPPAAIASQEEKRVNPSRPLNRENGGGGVPTLLVTQTEVGFEFAVSNLNFPALPRPKEQRFDG